MGAVAVAVGSGAGVGVAIGRSRAIGRRAVIVRRVETEGTAETAEIGTTVTSSGIPARQ